MKKILIVDDRELGHMVLKELIENPEHGVAKWVHCKLLQAYSGKEAIDIVHREKPDLILMDINMPETDGLKTTKQIRKLHKKLPIVAVTAQAMAHDEEDCLEAGCNQYISKPYNIQEMIDLMLKYLGATTHEKHCVH